MSFARAAGGTSKSRAVGPGRRVLCVCYPHIWTATFHHQTRRTHFWWGSNVLQRRCTGNWDEATKARPVSWPLGILITALNSLWHDPRLHCIQIITLLSHYMFFLISHEFTTYSTNGAISKYVVRKHLCGAIIQWWFSYIYRALCCAERSSNDDSPTYTVHYVVRASILLPVSSPLSQRAVAVLVCV
jgi:hypothetical protein